MTVCCFPVIVHPDEPAQEELSEAEQCVQAAVFPMTTSSGWRFSRADRSLIEVIEQRAEILAGIVLDAEDALKDMNYEPNAFSDEAKSWLVIERPDARLIGVYSRSSAGLVREDTFGSGEYETLVERLPLAEQVMAHTPQDCGSAFAVVDAGISDESGRDLLYALRLVDRQRELAWGMHYRFVAEDGALTDREALHFRCRSEGLSMSERAAKIAADNENAKFATREIMPAHDLPTEAQMMQFHLYRDLPFSTIFWLRGRVIWIDQGSKQMPARYHRMKNPCKIADQ